jgi:hypothetical protein
MTTKNWSILATGVTILLCSLPWIIGFIAPSSESHIMGVAMGATMGYLGIIVIYSIPCFLVALSGEGKQIGYWKVFLCAFFLSPVIGLIIGLVSSKLSVTNRLDDLEKLASLKDKGILTEEEFIAQKKKTLS